MHLDGYNQTDLITGKGPSKRNEIWYFTETTLAAARIGDFKYRFTDQPTGWFGPTDEGRLADRNQSEARPLRAHRPLNPVDRVLQLVHVRVLAWCVRAAGNGEARPDVRSTFRPCRRARASISKP